MTSFYEDLYKKPEFKPKAEPAKPVDNGQSIKDLAKSELPALVAQAIALAKQSDKLAEIMPVIKELSDRAYGKAAQAVDMTVAATVVHRVDVVRDILNQIDGRSYGTPLTIEHEGMIGTDRAKAIVGAVERQMEDEQPLFDQGQERAEDTV